MSTAPPFFTPARKKQAFLLVGVFALLIGLTSLLHYLQNQHKYVNTQGMIIYSSDSGSPGHSHIFIVKSDGTGLKQLTTGNENDIEPTFSPDGSSIAFISDKSGSNQVEVMDASATQISQISDGTDSKDSPQFTPDGNSVGYLSRGQLIVTDTVSLSSQLLFPVGSSSNISDSDNDSSTKRKSPVTQFGWSSIKTSQGYNLVAIQDDPDSDIETATFVPADPKQKTAVIFAGNKLDLAWSHDGNKLAIAALGVATFDRVKLTYQRQTISGIALFSADGIPVQQPLIAGTPTSNAGAQNLVFTADSAGLGFDVLGENKVGQIAEGGIAMSSLQPAEQPKLAAPPGAHNIGFSPDNTHALFQVPSAKNPADNDIVVVDMTTRNGQRITHGEGNVSSAQWSPAVKK